MNMEVKMKSLNEAMVAPAAATTLHAGSLKITVIWSIRIRMEHGTGKFWCFRICGFATRENILARTLASV